MIYEGDCLAVLKTLPDETADCCVTSPPYWGLRDYGTSQWEGGDPKCEHKVGRVTRTQTEKSQKQTTNTGSYADESIKIGEHCLHCGAKRVDQQVGLEATPGEYVSRLTAIFREVRRVLKKEGTLWLNLGDSYASGKSRYSSRPHTLSGKARGDDHDRKPDIYGNKIGIKDKDLVGIPWAVAFALRNDGWYIRQDIIWHKPNPMPESVRDRCTKAHEYIFLLAKSRQYYFDHNSIRERYTKPLNRYGGDVLKADGTDTWGKGTGQPGVYRKRNMRPDPRGRNKRSVWTIITRPYKGAHFATFPEELIEPCIKAGCPKDGTVLDPFFGAGTVGVVARKQGKNYIGIELNPEYIDMAQMRINNVQDRLF